VFGASHFFGFFFFCFFLFFFLLVSHHPHRSHYPQIFLTPHIAHSLKMLSFLVGGKLVDPKGVEVSLESLEGKHLLLYFSAHWCPPW
jgi:cytochrome oxidase Cu insertion factor (SCO1/SenC/PrrC family)